MLQDCRGFDVASFDIAAVAVFCCRWLLFGFFLLLLFAVVRVVVDHAVSASVVVVVVVDDDSDIYAYFLSVSRPSEVFPYDRRSSTCVFPSLLWRT